MESQTESVSLKIAILKFFTANAKTQPGLIQLLLSQDQGCLKSVINLLKSLKANPKEQLQVQLLEFLHGLWSQNCAVAMNQLKSQTDFWNLLTWPLFSDNLSTRLNGFILRIISAEIFAYKGTADKELMVVLDKLFDEKSETIQKWCDLMVNNASSYDLDVSVISANQDSDIGTFLLSSWKTLLIVLSKDQPITINPNVCHRIIDSLVKGMCIANSVKIQ